MEQLASGTSSTPLVAYIASTDLFKALDESTLQDLEAELELVHLLTAEVLFRQGDPGDSLYVLIRGRLGVSIKNPDGSEAQVDVLLPGVSVGEMALLTGQARVASVRALDDAELVKLPQAAFDRLAEKHPQAMKDLAQAIVSRLQRTQLASVLTNLFGELDALAIHDLQNEIEWQHLSSGEAIFRQGEPGDSMYIVVNGCLRSVVANPDGSERILGEVTRGESVGELALLTGDTRLATVYAVRDTDAVKISQSVFERLLERYPQAMMHLARIIVRRARQTVRVLSIDSVTAATFAVVPAHPAAPLSEFAHRLAETLAMFGPTLHLTSERFDREYGKLGAAQTAEDHPTNVMLVGWLSDQETRYRYRIYEADRVWSPWTQRCLRQADRILILGQAESDPALGEIETAMQRMAIKAQTELVLLHPDSTQQPVGTRNWLAQRQVHTHHHVRLGVDEGFQHLARRLTGFAIGLALSGGGARAYAHIGAIRALEEAGIQVDLVGGTSMGALIGALYAMGRNYDQIAKLAATFSSRRRLLDFTPPMVSFFATRKITNVLFTLFDEMYIEDLWRPFFCVSSNLTRAQPIVHREGPLWKGVRASIAIPGVFTPILHNGDLLVDGGVLNNLPIDVMREACGNGLVIGVSVSPTNDMVKDYQFGPSISGWQVLWSKLNPFAKSMPVPSIFAGLMRAIEINGVYQRKAMQSLADLFIQPPVQQFGILDFSSYDKIIEIGYHAAQQQIEAWQSNRVRSDA